MATELKKAKGKPKAKIKLVDTQVSYNEQRITTTTRVASSEEFLPLPVATRSLQHNDSENPLITVNLSENDKIVSVVADKQTTAKKQTDRRRISKSSEERSESQNTVIDGPSSLGNLEEVKQSFINLIEHNKLQYFHLSAIIYSVIIVTLVCYYILVKDDNETSNNNRFLLAILPLLALILIALSSLSSPNELPAAIELHLDGSRNNREANLRLKVSQLQKSIGVILALALLYLPSTFTALNYFPPEGASNRLSTAVNPAEQMDGTRQNFRWFLLNSSLPYSALLVLAYLQPLLLSGSSKLVRILSYLFTLPLFAQIPLRYYYVVRRSRESKLDPSQVVENHYRLSIALIVFLPIAIGFSLIRESRFLAMARKRTFNGAIQLIEAKVSLEHQRQQQETLLLSVLPAYVAEQVKRTMLKKITSNTGDNGQQQQQSLMVASTNGGGCISGGTTQDISAYQTNLAVVQTDNSANCQTTSKSNTPRGSVSVLEMPTATSDLRGGTGESCLMSMASGCQVNRQQQSIGFPNQQPLATITVDKRPSFTLSSKFTLGLASSASYLSEAATNKFSHKQTSATNNSLGVSNSLSSAPTNFNLPFVTTNQQQQQQQASSRRGFNELYIRTYNNVSLLYGDIVGFTKLCSQLSSSQLVRVLNDLFSHFDILAERHKIMRIKILGDCYYGVSGIPEFAVMGAKSRASRNDNHAINCVNMGLDMIHYIKCLNVERATTNKSSTTSEQQQQQVDSVAIQTAKVNSNGNSMPEFELNMRLGIHTGHIHSGVIGLKKWQFDVWSNDVSIAMHCESSGLAGRVQVTEATLQQLNGAFTYENAHGSKRDSFLASKDIKTYFIRERANPSLSSNKSKQPSSLEFTLKQPATATRMISNKLQTNRLRKFSNSTSQQQTNNTNNVKRNMDEDNIRVATIGTIRQTLIANETCSGPFQSCGLSFNHQDMSFISMSYHDQKLRKLYSQKPIDNVSSEIFALLLLLALILPLMNAILIPTTKQVFIITLLTATFIAILLITILLLPRGNREERETQLIEQPIEIDIDNNLQQSNKFDVIGVNVSKEEKKKVKIRPLSDLSRATVSYFNKLFAISKKRTPFRSFAIIFTLIVSISSQLYLISIGYCRQANSTNYETSFSTSLTVITILIAIDNSVNLLSYRSKSILILSIIIVHLSFAFKLVDLQHLSCINNSNLSHHKIEWSSEILVLILALCSLIYARQCEYIKKASFLWRNRLNVDHEELEYISGINKVLLENILPSHVVQYYMTHPNEQPKNNNLSTSKLSAYVRMSFSNISSADNELYHEQHENVAVMFASIPHFYEFYDESDISKQGLGCIALLNEIICDFDKLLLKNKFSRIEKIKTIGSTYMAAAGLRPCYLVGTGRNSTSSQNSNIPSTNCISAAGHQNSPSQQQQVATCQFTRASNPLSGGCSARLNSSLDCGNNNNSITNSLSATVSLDTDERKLVLSQEKLNLICMIQFASNLMDALNGINKQSFQGFKLRVGVNTGSVIAGVIGAQRPFYDIWGDCVNIASRMESLGEVGRIQVEEKTVKLLRESLCLNTYSIVRRGPIDVKGKGGMVTYFVDRRTTTTVLANKESGEQQGGGSLGFAKEGQQQVGGFNEEATSSQTADSQRVNCNATTSLNLGAQITSQQASAMEFR